MTNGDWPLDASSMLGAHPAALMVSTFAPGEGFPHLHVHDRHTELFAVLSGVLRVSVAGVASELAAGQSVFVDPGVSHSFVALGDASARVAIVVSPADALQMIVELGGTGGDIDAIERVLDRYDSHIV